MTTCACNFVHIFKGTQARIGYLAASWLNLACLNLHTCMSPLAHWHADDSHSDYKYHAITCLATNDSVAQVIQL